MNTKGVATLSQGTRIAVALTAVIGVFAGCGGESEPQEQMVATGGGVRVSLADFHDAYNRITPNYRPDITTLEGKHAFANDLVNKEILMAESIRLGGLSDEMAVKAIDEQKEQGILSILYREEVEDKVEVLGADVKELWDKRQMNVRASHILVEDVEEARRIKSEIDSGAIEFEAAARKYSMDLSSRRKGGSIGEIAWGHTMPEFQSKAFEMEPGVLSDPVTTVFGVHLLRVDEQLPQELGTLEEMRPLLRNEVRRQLEARRMKEFVSSIEQKAGLVWNKDGVATIQELLRDFKSVDIDTVSLQDQYVPRPTDEQRSVVIASFSGRDLTVGDVTDGIADVPPANRMQSVIPRSGIAELIRSSQIQTHVLLGEARERGLEQRPEVVQKIARLHEQISIELVHARFIQAADVPQLDVKALYDSSFAADPELFRIPEQVDMLIIVNTDEGKVRKALKEIADGSDVAAVINRSSMDARTRFNGGQTGPIGRGSYAPQIEDMAFSREPGTGWSEPLVTESGTGAVSVLERTESRLATFEDMETMITNQMARARGEQAFEEWLKAEREKIGVEIHDDVLELIGQAVS